MDKHIAFVVMAAGAGSRYKGAKQLETFGPKQLTIAEYNAIHAMDAGFKDFYFVINEKLAEEFNKRLKTFFPKTCKFGLIYQRQEKALSKFNNRQKPWGTGHAVLCCDRIVKSNFCVSNADDLYGKDAIFRAAEFLRSADPRANIFANVAYSLPDTLPDSGAVSRAVIHGLDEKYIDAIVETGGLSRQSMANGPSTKHDLVSMNLWGFTPKIFELLRAGWEIFTKNRASLCEDEFFLPSLINDAIGKNQCKVEILRTNSKWAGVTYQTDKNLIENLISK